MVALDNTLLVRSRRAEDNVAYGVNLDVSSFPELS